MTGPRTRLVVALCCLLVGCGTTVTDDTPSDGLDTLTPVEVPAVSSTPTPTPARRTETELAPGVTGTGVEDPFALAAAHRGGLRNGSFRLVRTLNVTRPDGTVLRRTVRRATVGPNASRYHLVDTSVDTVAYPVRGVAPRIEVWWAGGPALFRLSGDGEVRYARTDDVPPTGPAGDLTLRDRISGLLSTTDTTVVGREPDDPVRVILVSNGFRSESVLRVPVLLERPRNVTFRLSVDVTGVVRNYDIGYDASFRGERVTVHRRVSFTDVETSVAPPDWHERALNASGVGGPRPDTPGRQGGP